MDFEEIRELEEGEVMVFEKEEELALPPDVVRTLKLVIGQLSKLIGYKYKAKYKYTKPGSEKKSSTEVEQAKKKPEEEEEPEEDKKKKKTQEKIHEAATIIPPGSKEIENAEISKELAESLKELSKLVEGEGELDPKAVQEKIDEMSEQLTVGSGGEAK